MEEHMTLATELLHEVKQSAKRWFIIALAELVAIIVLVAGFLWYISLPIEEYGTILQDADGQSFNQIVKGDIYGK